VLIQRGDMGTVDPPRTNPILSALSDLHARGVVVLDVFDRAERRAFEQHAVAPSAVRHAPDGDDDRVDIEEARHWLDGVEGEVGRLLGPRAVLGMQYELLHVAGSEPGEYVREEYRELWRGVSAQCQWLADLVAKASEPAAPAGEILP
jgi:hypothetical protein